MPFERNDSSATMMYASQNQTSYFGAQNQAGFHHHHQGHHECLHEQHFTYQGGYDNASFVNELKLLNEMSMSACDGNYQKAAHEGRYSCSSASSECSTSSGNSHETSFEEIPVQGYRKNQQYRAKYKTEICKDWELNRQCPKGDKCSFAHGLSELRKKVHVSQKYKTTKCRSFHEKGYCIYGPRCQFLHDVRLEGSNINMLSHQRLSYKQLLNENLTHLNDLYARSGCDLMAFLQSNIYYSSNNSERVRGRLSVFQSFAKGK